MTIDANQLSRMLDQKQRKTIKLFAGSYVFRVRILEDKFINGSNVNTIDISELSYNTLANSKVRFNDIGESIFYATNDVTIVAPEIKVQEGKYFFLSAWKLKRVQLSACWCRSFKAI